MNRREQVRVIALDGTEAVGGTGYVAAALLAELQRRLDEGHRQSFLNRTTVFAGTSAGSANALFLAMTLDPDTALAGIQDFWVESERIASRESMGVTVIARALIGLGSFMSTRKLRGFYLNHFGMAKLGDLPHQVVIPSVCLDSPTDPGRWRPKSFTNLDPNGPDMEKLVVDVLLSSSSPPLLSPVYQSLTGEGPGYVDGGLWANNPSMAAVAEIAHRRGDGSTDGITVLSVSNGDAELGMRPRFRNGFGDVGYLGWLLNPKMPGALLDLMLTAEEEATGYIAQALLVERFRRLDPDVPGRMLEFTAQGIERCVRQVLELETTRTQIEDTLAWLAKVDWFGVG